MSHPKILDTKKWGEEARVTWGASNILRHLTELKNHSKLTPGICAHLPYVVF
jgi:hypothetical protein